MPLAAVSTLGAVSLTYFLGRSHPNNLTHVAPPFVAMVTLWSALAWRSWVRDRAPIAAVGVALAGVCAALLIAQQLPELVDKAPDSALAAAVHSATGDGNGLAQSVRALTDLPLIDRRTLNVEALVRANVPGAAPLLVAVEPAVATETLIRLDRSDVLPDRHARAGRPLGEATPDAAAPGAGHPLRHLRRDAGREHDGARARAARRAWSMSSGASTRSSRSARSAGYRVFRLGCGPA